jgi:TonB family protein
VSEKHNHIDRLTPEVLRDYHAGQLSKEQMHQVEKLMLDDPFYADALEGLEEYPADIIDQDLDALDQRLDELTQEAPSGFPWFKMAAAIILIATVAGLFWINQDKEIPSDAEEIRMEEAAPPAPGSTQPSVLQDASTTSPSPALKKAEDSIILPDNRLEEKLNAGIEEEEVSIEADEMMIMEEATEAARAVPKVTKLSAPKGVDQVEINIPMYNYDVSIDSVNQVLRRRVAGVAMSKARAAASTNTTKTLKGRIVDSDDKMALPGVNILIKGTTTGAVTNAKGFYEINLSTTPVTLVYRYLGYVTQEIVIVDQDSLNLSLVPDDVSLGEVVVTGIQWQEDENKRIDEFAQPEDGYSIFNQYLKENLVYPRAQLGSGIKGSVALRFTVDEDGQVTNFDITKSLGEAFDQEAIRLIREGPKWIPATDYKGDARESQVKVRIRFKE